MSRVLTLSLIFASAVAVACSDQVPSSQPKSDKSHLASDGGEKTDTSANPSTPTTPTPPSDTIINPLPEAAGIHGYVVGPVQAGDSVGQAGIRSVHVTLVRSGTEIASTTTDDIGSFSFGDVADGVYLLRATPGASSPYAPAERSDVTVRDGHVADGQVVIVLKKK